MSPSFLICGTKSSFQFLWCFASSWLKYLKCNAHTVELNKSKLKGQVECMTTYPRLSVSSYIRNAWITVWDICRLDLLYSVLFINLTIYEFAFKLHTFLSIIIIEHSSTDTKHSEIKSIHKYLQRSVAINYGITCGTKHVLQVHWWGLSVLN